jgi:uncharacterized membrane protein
MSPRQRVTLFLAASAVCVLIAIYYLIPGIYHVFSFSGSPTDSHLKHALLFFGLAVLGVIASRFAARSRVSTKS